MQIAMNQANRVRFRYRFAGLKQVVHSLRYRQRAVSVEDGT